MALVRNEVHDRIRTGNRQSELSRRWRWNMIRLGHIGQHSCLGILEPSKAVAQNVVHLLICFDNTGVQKLLCVW